MIQASSRSCSGASASISSSRAAGISTAPSSSTTMTSPGKTATPPQPMGCCQATKVRPATEGGAAAPLHHTGRQVASTPATSRTTPSVTSAATFRLAMRAHRMSPKMPASVTPIESTTAMQPAGMSSMAARVEIGDDHDSGVARSSRAGTKRSVKARPTSRGCPGRSGRVPRSQTLRRPFFSRMVVSVAVVIFDRMSMVLASSCMLMALVMVVPECVKKFYVISARRRVCRALRWAMSAMSSADNLGPGLRMAADAITPRSASMCLRTARPMPACCSYLASGR